MWGNHETNEVIDSYRERRMLRTLQRMDAEEEENGNQKVNHGNTRLPYGIAKGKGIDTTGMEPKEVWEALAGEGVSAKEEYRKLKERGSKGKEGAAKGEEPKKVSRKETIRELKRKYDECGERMSKLRVGVGDYAMFMYGKATVLSNSYAAFAEEEGIKSKKGLEKKLSEYADKIIEQRTIYRNLTEHEKKMPDQFSFRSVTDYYKALDEWKAEHCKMAKEYGLGDFTTGIVVNELIRQVDEAANNSVTKAEKKYNKAHEFFGWMEEHGKDFGVKKFEKEKQDYQDKMDALIDEYKEIEDAYLKEKRAYSIELSEAVPDSVISSKKAAFGRAFGDLFRAGYSTDGKEEQKRVDENRKLLSDIYAKIPVLADPETGEIVVDGADENAAEKVKKIREDIEKSSKEYEEELTKIDEAIYGTDDDERPKRENFENISDYKAALEEWKKGRFDVWGSEENAENREEQLCEILDRNREYLQKVLRFSRKHGEYNDKSISRAKLLLKNAEKRQRDGEKMRKEYEEKRSEYHDVIKKRFPELDDCDTKEQLTDRINAEGLFNSDNFYSEIEIEETIKAIEPVAKMMERFPKMKGKVGTIHIKNELSNADAYGESAWGGDVSLSADYYKDPERLRRSFEHDVDEGFHPYGTDSDAIVVHEYGHQLDHILKRNGDYFSNEVMEKVKKHFNISGDEARRGVSLYAVKGATKYGVAGSRNWEFFAEAWGEYVNSESPREIATFVGHLVEERLEELYGKRTDSRSEKEVQDLIRRMEYYKRRRARLDAKAEGDDEDSSGNHGNTHLPYGIAKGEGIDTTGMTPKEVWEALEGKGVSPKEEYKKLKERNTNPKASDKEYYEAAKDADNAIEFWGNLTDEQREKVGKDYKEIYERVKKEAGERETYRPTFKTVDDMPTTITKRPPEKMKFEFGHKSKGDVMAVSIGNNDTIMINDDYDIGGSAEEHGTLSRNVLVHELGHVLSNSGLKEEVMNNYGDMWGKFNRKTLTLDEPVATHPMNTPEEMFAESFSQYMVDPDFYRNRQPKVASYFDRLIKDNDWINGWVYNVCKQFEEETGKTFNEREESYLRKIGASEKDIESYKKQWEDSDKKWEERLRGKREEKTALGDFKCPEAQKKSLQGVIKRTSNLKKEQYRIIGADGNVIVENKGDGHSVATTVGEKRDAFWDHPGSVSIHNHPAGGTFSSADFRDFGFGASEIYAAAPEGTYVLRAKEYSEKKRPDWIGLRDSYDESVPNDMSTIELRRQARKKPEIEGLQKEIGEMSEKLLKEYKRMQESGASREELMAFANNEELNKKNEELKSMIDKEARRLEVEPNDRFLRENAEKYGFEYFMIPHKKKRADSRSEEEVERLISLMEYYQRRKSRIDSKETDVTKYRERRKHRLNKAAIEKHRGRRAMRLDDEEENKGNNANHGNTHLPYGIAKGEGIDTEGMSPKEVWEALEGEGYSAKEEYRKLKERGEKKEDRVANSKDSKKMEKPFAGYREEKKRLSDKISKVASKMKKYEAGEFRDARIAAHEYEMAKEAAEKNGYTIDDYESLKEYIDSNKSAFDLAKNKKMWERTEEESSFLEDYGTKRYVAECIEIIRDDSGSAEKYQKCLKKRDGYKKEIQDSINEMNKIRESQDWSIGRKIYSESERAAEVSRAKDNIQISKQLDSFDDSFRTRIADSVDKLSDCQLSSLNKALKNARFKKIGADETSNYDPSTGVISLREDCGVRTFYHELGHYMDDFGESGFSGEYHFTDADEDSYLIETDSRPLSFSSLLERSGFVSKESAEELNKAVEKIMPGRYSFDVSDYGVPMITRDGNQLWEDFDLDVVNKLIRKFRDNDGRQEYLDSIGWVETPEYSDYMETYFTPKRMICRSRERFKGADEKYSSDLRAALDKQYEIQQQHPEYFEKMAEFDRERRRKEEALCAASDILCAWSHGTLSSIYGDHDRGYFRRDTGTPFREITANLHSIFMENNEDAKAFLREIMPKTMKKAEDCYNEWMWMNV